MTLKTPETVTLGDASFVFRPPVEGDETAVLAFTRALQPNELLFLPTDMTQVENVRAWIADSIAGRSLTTLALLDNQIVAYCTIARSPVEWMRHVADLRLIVAASARRRGLGRALTIEAVRNAVDSGVEKIIAEITIEQTDAIAMFRRIGFQSEAVLRDHVRDREGELHDLVIMSHHTAQLLSAYGLAAGAGGYVTTRPPAAPIMFPRDD